jgi:hypothetical protein
MPTFEEILQASKFIFKILEMRGPCTKVSYFNRYNWPQEVWKKSLTNHPFDRNVNCEGLSTKHGKKTQILTNNFFQKVELNSFFFRNFFFITHGHGQWWAANGYGMCLSKYWVLIDISLKSSWHYFYVLPKNWFM